MRNPFTEVTEPEFLFFLVILISTVTRLVFPEAWLANLGILAFALAIAALLVWMN